MTIFELSLEISIRAIFLPCNRQTRKISKAKFFDLLNHLIRCSLFKLSSI